MERNSFEGIRFLDLDNRVPVLHDDESDEPFSQCSTSTSLQALADDGDDSVDSSLAPMNYLPAQLSKLIDRSKLPLQRSNSPLHLKHFMRMTRMSYLPKLHLYNSFQSHNDDQSVILADAKHPFSR